ncbi:hypothetical protein MRX96_016789 [Rhipicephalus microplus]
MLFVSVARVRRPGSLVRRVCLARFSLRRTEPDAVIFSRTAGFQFAKKSASLSSEWEPRKKRLWKILLLLKLSTSNEETTRLNARNALGELGKCVDFNNYMVLIFTEGGFQYNDPPRDGTEISVKKVSPVPGLIPRGVTVDDQVELITAALSYFIVTPSEIELRRWPELLAQLGNLFEIQEDRINEAVLGTLHKISRNYANEAAMVQADAFVTTLLQMRFDSDSEVQKTMCRTLALLLEYDIDCLIPHIHSVVEYIMNKMKDRNKDVAMEA